MNLSKSCEERGAGQSKQRERETARTSRADVLGYFRTIFEVSQALTPDDLESVFRLRYQVYCVENSFEPKELNPGSRETDRFDWHSVHSILRHRESEEIIGTVRLVLPLSGKLPIQELQPNPLDAIKDHLPLERTAEVSRFAVSRSFRRRKGEGRYPDQSWQKREAADIDSEAPYRRLMPYLSIGLLQGVVRLSLAQGITHLCAIMDPSLLRLLARFGLHFKPIGEPVNYHGVRQPCYAELEGLLEVHAQEQPDIWSLTTDGGTLVPGLQKPGLS